MGRRNPHIEAHGHLPDGTTVELKLEPRLSPRHHSTHGRYVIDLDGNRWTPLHGMRSTSDGRVIGGPGWYEPLDVQIRDDEEAPDEDEREARLSLASGTAVPARL